jgi:hypothetical protein
MNRNFAQEAQALFARETADTRSSAPDGSDYALSPDTISRCTGFFNRVLPSAGLRCAMTKSKKGKVEHRFFRTNEELARIMQRFDGYGALGAALV